ncbi:zf-HC2 domain-containing protein [Desulfitibacter alkalitolerans]|uniref:zf-HC2 domain-containing protein n=1 Tax=Desulfitibacter alkalitolerans TaxID=264641 RepID=UPI000483FFE6|nr:zf-HC2 domain-containing protein [Desulfitibacter alkalitolerans]
MKCQENRQMIYTYLDGELSTYEERNLYSHMAACDACQLDMERARNLHSLLEKTVKHVKPPRGFAERVMANLPSKSDAGQAQAFAELDFFKEESAANEFVKEDVENIKESKKTFRFGSRWIGIAAGLAFAFLAITGISQVASIAIDPKAEDGFFVVITPKAADVLIAEHYGKEQQIGNPDEKEVTDSSAGSKQESETITETDPAVISGDSPAPNNSKSTNGEAPQGSGNSTEGRESSHVIAANTEKDDPFVTKEPIVIAANPTSTVTLTPLSENVLGAAWSSSGNSLLYLTGDGSGVQVYESQVNGEGKKTMGSYSAAGRWSPNREYISYTQTVNGKSTIWVEGRGDKQNLTPEETGARGEGSKWAYSPVWSSRNEIAFLTDRFGGTDIMVVDMDGNSRRVTFSGDKKDGLTWSPDGTQIAYFKSWEDKGSRVGEIVVVPVNGETSKSVTPTVKATNMAATWSPDGRLLAVNITGEEQGIWVTSTDGSGWDRRLTTKGGGKTIKWSSDGQKIAFNDSLGVFHILIWRSAQANVDMIQITPMGGQMANASIEWSRDSNEVLLEQPIPGSNQKSVWIATLPKSINAY